MGVEDRALVEERRAEPQFLAPLALVVADAILDVVERDERMVGAVVGLCLEQVVVGRVGRGGEAVQADAVEHRAGRIDAASCWLSLPLGLQAVRRPASSRRLYKKGRSLGFMSIVSKSWAGACFVSSLWPHPTAKLRNYSAPTKFANRKKLNSFPPSSCCKSWISDFSRGISPLSIPVFLSRWSL